MPADGTRLAGIAWVDLHDRDSRERCLVREESRELLERPARQLVASISAPSRDPSPDAFEVLDGNPAAGAPGGLDDRLADAMVFMTAEPGLLAGYPHEFLLGSSGSLPLEALSLDVVLAADSFDRLAAMPPALSLVVAILAIPMSTPRKSVTGTGEPSGTSMVTIRNHLPSFLSTRSH